MKIICLHLIKRVFFKHWSRKNYALFASLQTVVHFAHVSVEITDASLKKSKKIANATGKLTRLFKTLYGKPDDTSFILSSGCLCQEHALFLIPVLSGLYKSHGLMRHLEINTGQMLYPSY